MKAGQKGFTLIELVVVIVILGILAATALPKFIDLSADAGEAAAKGVAGSIGSATSINYAKEKAKTGSATSITATSTCATLQGLITGADFTNDFEWTSSTANLVCTGGSGAADTTCSVKSKKGGVAQTVTAICTG